MSNKIYTRAFVEHVRKELKRLDDLAGEAERALYTISQLQGRYVAGRKGRLGRITNEQSTTSSAYNHLARMESEIADMHSQRDDLMQWLDELDKGMAGDDFE